MGESANAIPSGLRVEDVGVEVVVDVVDADVDGAAAVAEGFVPIDADVHALVVRHAVVVATADVVGGVVKETLCVATCGLGE